MLCLGWANARPSLALAALALGGLVTAAAPSEAHAESPRDMTVTLHLGAYAPQVDEQFTTATPWDDVFGDSTMFLMGVEVGYHLFKGHGTLAVTGGWRYGWIDGAALGSDGEASDDEVGFNFMPFTANLVYRWDWASVRHGVPLVPYVKVGLTAALWWATNGKDEIANVSVEGGDPRTGRGLTFGWQVGGGIQFLLDALAPSMAKEFDVEVGVNNSFLFAEFMYTELNDFGSSESINLGDAAFSFGLMFEF